MRSSFLFFIFLFLSFLMQAQIMRSRNGAGVFPHGELRVLVIYAEINYNDEAKNQTTRARWPQGFLPKDVAWLFDPVKTEEPKGELTRYFSDMSMGQFTVLGNHLKRMVTVSENDIKNLGSHRDVTKAIVQQANNQFRKFKPGNRELSAEDFDSWTRKRQGMPWVEESNQAFDHVMVFVRNWKEVWWSEGHPNSSLPDSLLGYGCDGWISYNTLSFDIIKHEFGHFLLGGNNFHCCGGHDNTHFPSYFMATQCGWGMMGNASSTLKTVNAFERRRLDWRHPNKRMVLSSGEGAAERSTDLDAMEQGSNGTYLLRDFITTGDALRIKLPFLPDSELQQWLWLEYHAGVSEFDNYKNVDCQAPFQPGVYAYVQCGKEVISGRGTFGGFADYIKPIPAMGFYDAGVELGSGRIPDQCVWSGRSSPSEDHYPVAFELENPLTGYSDLQHIEFDENGDGTIAPKERFTNHTTLESGTPVNDWSFRGHPRHAFHGAKNKLSIGTNPSTASHLTLVSTDKVYRAKRAVDKNNRTVYLNGIEVVMTEIDSNVVEVKVSYNRPILQGAVHWQADSIVLNDLRKTYLDLPENRFSLVLSPGSELNLSRGKSPTRMTMAERPNGEPLFNSATKLTLAEGAQMLIDDAHLFITDDSVLELMPGAKIYLRKKGKLSISEKATVILHGDAKILDRQGKPWQPEDEGQLIRKT